jgi:hypothetical protein
MCARRAHSQTAGRTTARRTPQQGRPTAACPGGGGHRHPPVGNDGLRRAPVDRRRPRYCVLSVCHPVGWPASKWLVVGQLACCRSHVCLAPMRGKTCPRRGDGKGNSAPLAHRTFAIAVSGYRPRARAEREHGADDEHAAGSRVCAGPAANSPAVHRPTIRTDAAGAVMNSLIDRANRASYCGLGRISPRCPSRRRYLSAVRVGGD